MTARPLAPFSVSRKEVIDATRVTAAIIATFAVLAPVAHLAGQPDELVVLGVIVALSSTRSAVVGERPSTRRLLVRALEFPLVVAVVGYAGTLLVNHRLWSDALFVVACAAALWTRRAPPAVHAIVRLVQLPLVAMLIAPVPVVDRGVRGLPWLVVAATVATTMGTLAQLLRPQRRAQAPDPPARPRPSDREGRPRRIEPTTKLALQTAVGLTLAFAIGQNCFSPRWTWTVISAYTVGAGARSRGDVLLRGTERVLGALGGAVVGTTLARIALGSRDLSVVAIFALIATGLVLRARTYAVWAFCVTGSLVFLYSLLGESAGGLLGERLEEVAVGAACAIVAAALVYPIPTEAVARRAMADALAAADELLERAPALTAAALEAHHAVLEGRIARLHQVSQPLRVARHLRLPGGHLLEWIALAEDHVRRAQTIVSGDLAMIDARVIGGARRSLGVVRRHLRSRLPPISEAALTAGGSDERVPG